jgi:hypothetical protein
MTRQAHTTWSLGKLDRRTAPGSFLPGSARTEEFDRTRGQVPDEVREAMKAVVADAHRIGELTVAILRRFRRRS